MPEIMETAIATPIFDGNNGVMETSAVPVFPPKPDAYMTLITDDDMLPGAQTLLYSIHKTTMLKHQKEQKAYPPELVVLATPNVSVETREALCPLFCTRIVDVTPLQMPLQRHDPNASSSVPIKRQCYDELFDTTNSLTKLHVFGFPNYDTIVYIDVDCLVVQDISNLIQLGKVYIDSEALIAAAPDMFPPDKFNSGVMVVRPKPSVFHHMMAQTKKEPSYDDAATGFLNSYFDTWFSDFPPQARLSFGYNAQQVMHDYLTDQYPNYWELTVGKNLYVVHFSNQPKPWDTKTSGTKKVKTSDSLISLWQSYYQKSKNYATRIIKDQQTAQSKATITTSASATPTASSPAGNKRSTPSKHKLIAKRYKELRTQQNLPIAEAMEQARREYGDDDTDNNNPSSQVAAMFGLSGIL